MSNAVVSTPQWTSLNLLRSQFEANMSVLRQRDPELAAKIDAASPVEPYFLLANDDRVTLAKQVGQTLQGLPNPVPPVAAQQICEKLFPAGPCSEAVMVAGIDQGWIWDALYRLETKAAYPFHRPPLYFLAYDVARLWTTLHFQDWSQLLGDDRVTIFGGPDAASQYRDRLLANPRLPLPRLSLTVEPAIWQNGDPSLASADLIYNAVLAGWADRLQSIARSLQSAYPGTTGATIAHRLAAGQKLRVLGVTSRYTTFLQHSMRDWLAAFNAMGHETSLIIEQADHQTMNNVVYLSQIADFRPDLILIIDHYRAEYHGLPAGVPVVMWVQDRLPNIFNDAAGPAQGERDFCLGFGRTHLAHRHGYPAQRFLTCPVGINEMRFDLREPTTDELAKFGCDASYVSHASETAEQIVDAQCAECDANTVRFYRQTYDRMVAHYERDPRILSDVLLRRIIDATTKATGLTVSAEMMPGIISFLTQRVNSAMVRHQSLTWLAELGLDLRLYGRGWDKHPTLAKYARGVADNHTDLANIYRCSKINLQVTSFGSVHQRMLDGLAAGGFFLTRWNQGDAFGEAYRAIWNWCEANGITDDTDLRHRASTEVRARITEIDTLHDYDTASYDMPLYDLIRSAADAAFTLSGDSVWGTKDFDRVAFRTKADLHAKVTAFLADYASRRVITLRMRQETIARFSYRHISQELLNLIARQLPETRQENRVMLEAA